MNPIQQILLRSGAFILMWHVMMPLSVHAADQKQASDSFKSYPFIATRNIFSPDRRGARKARKTEEKIKQQDYILLTGTLIQDGKALAFFSGSQNDFHKVLSVGGEIQGATITQVDTHQVEVDRNGARTKLPIGTIIQMDDNGEWKLKEETDDTPSIPTAAIEGSNGDTQPVQAVGGSASDLLKRLQERRQKELNK